MGAIKDEVTRAAEHVNLGLLQLAARCVVKRSSVHSVHRFSEIACMAPVPAALKPEPAMV